MRNTDLGSEEVRFQFQVSNYFHDRCTGLIF